MSLEREQVINARFPHASGGRGKKRPVVVVQADVYNQRLRHAIVGQLTTNLNDADRETEHDVTHGVGRAGNASNCRSRPATD